MTPMLEHSSEYALAALCHLRDAIRAMGWARQWAPSNPKERRKAMRAARNAARRAVLHAQIARLTLASHAESTRWEG